MCVLLLFICHKYHDLVHAEDNIEIDGQVEAVLCSVLTYVNKN